METTGTQNKPSRKDMVGRRVRHLYSRTEGTIIKQFFNFVTVVFDESEEKRTFSYPSCIGRYLELLEDVQEDTDTSDNHKNDNDIEAETGTNRNTVYTGNYSKTPLYEELYCKPDEYSNNDISELVLSVRSDNALRRIDCHIISKLLTLSELDLMTTKNLGRKSADEIIDKLRTYLKDEQRLAQISAMEKAKEEEIRKRLKNTVIAFLRDEQYSEEILTGEEQERFAKYKSACEELDDKTICLDAINNPELYITIISMFNEAFAFEYLLKAIQTKLSQKLSVLPKSITSKKAQPFLYAYAISKSKHIDMLTNLCSSDDLINRLPYCLSKIEGVDLLKDMATQFYAFAEWLLFDIEEVKNNILRKMEDLKEREKQVISLRSSGKTLQELSDEMNVTRERVRQIEGKAIRVFNSAYIKQKYDLLALVAALRDGDYILCHSEVEDMLGDEITRYIWTGFNSRSKSKDKDIILRHNYYRYVPDLDAVVFSNVTKTMPDGLHMTITQALDLLPEVIAEDELTEKLKNAASQAGLPLELIEIKFKSAYSLRGRFYHSSRITVGFMCDVVLKEHYPNGCKVNDIAEQNQFSAYIIEHFGESAKMTNRAIAAKAAEVGILCDRGTYIHPSYISIDESIFEKVDQYIAACPRFEISYSEIFDALSGYMQAAGIPNRFFLQGVIKKYNRNYISNKDYIIKDGWAQENLYDTQSGNVSVQQVDISQFDVNLDKAKKIIISKFQNGYRPSSNIDFERFTRYYADEYCEEPGVEAAILDSYLSSVAVLYDDRAYLYADSTISTIHEFITRQNAPCISIKNLFEQYNSDMYNLGIYSADMLKAFIMKNLPDISYRNDYLYMQEDISPTALVREVFNEKAIWTFDELFERLHFLKQDTVRQLMNHDEYIRIDTGVFTHIDNLELPDSEGQKIIDFVENQLSTRDYVIANELDLTNFMNPNPHCTYDVIRDAVFTKFLSSNYSKSGQIITRPGKRIKVLDILEQYCREVDSATFDELNSMEAAFDAKGRSHSACLTAANNVLTRVSDDLFVKDDKVNFDIEKIDDIIALYCQDEFTPLRNVTDFSLFPYAGYSWNLFLLESFLRKHSRAFSYDVRADNSSNVGVIVRKSFNYSGYDDILSYALAKSTLSLHDKKAVVNFLYDKGYIAWRNLGSNESNIIEKAIDLREEGAA